MKGIAIALVMLCCGSAVWSQDVPRAEVFGGYSYLNVDTNNLTSRQSLNGWEASAAGNFNRWFAVEGDVSGYYKTYLGVNVSDYGFAGGPRFNFRPIFVHALVGGDHLTGSTFGFSGSQNSFAGVFGGGIQWNIARQWAVRGSGDYVLTRHNILGGSPFTQNNFRASVGIVFLLGGMSESSSRTGSPHEKSPHASSHKPNTSTPLEALSEAPVLGVSGYATTNGLRVAAIQPGSLGAQAGINVGDLIMQIDGRLVQSGRDIELAIAASQTGRVIVGFMVNRMWLVEREVKVR
jgi:hypothetical protein